MSTDSPKPQSIAILQVDKFWIEQLSKYEGKPATVKAHIELENLIEYPISHYRWDKVFIGRSNWMTESLLPLPTPAEEPEWMLTLYIRKEISEDGGFRASVVKKFLSFIGPESETVRRALNLKTPGECE